MVWLGAASVFLVHVAITVSLRVAGFQLLPRTAVDVVVAVLFLAGAIYSFHIRKEQEEEARVNEAGSAVRTVGTAAAVIFVAEWGDLTQILTANLAAHYHSAISLGVGTLIALWAVAGVGREGSPGVGPPVDGSPPWLTPTSTAAAGCPRRRGHGEGLGP